MLKKNTTNPTNSHYPIQLLLGWIKNLKKKLQDYRSGYIYIYISYIRSCIISYITVDMEFEKKNENLDCKTRKMMKNNIIKKSQLANPT